MATTKKLAYQLLTLAGLLGFVASFWQMLEKLELLKNSHATLSCNLSSTFSCSNVLNAHQSSVFGFPNALLCICFFAIIVTVGVIGWTGSEIHKNIRLFLQAVSLFFVGFGYWYFWQSIFNLGTICVFCIFCFAAVIAINWSWVRLNYGNYGRLAGKFERLTQSGGDTFFWMVAALVIVLEGIIKFR